VCRLPRPASRLPFAEIFAIAELADSGFPLNIPRLLVIPQSDKAAMPQVRIRRLFHELELRHKQRLEPPALRHLRGRQTAP